MSECQHCKATCPRCGAPVALLILPSGRPIPCDPESCQHCDEEFDPTAHRAHVCEPVGEEE